MLDRRAAALVVVGVRTTIRVPEVRLVADLLKDEGVHIAAANAVQACRQQLGRNRLDGVDRLSLAGLQLGPYGLLACYLSPLEAHPLGLQRLLVHLRALFSAPDLFRGRVWSQRYSQAKVVGLSAPSSAT